MRTSGSRSSKTVRHVVHPAPGHPAGTLADALKERGTTWSLLGGTERAGIVHRLDRDTSGLLVVAKTETAHRNLAKQLSDRSLGRTYWALVHGGFREDTGTIDAPIARHPRDRRKMAIVEGGREAITDFRVVERLAARPSSRCRCAPGAHTRSASISRPSDIPSWATRCTVVPIQLLGALRFTRCACASVTPPTAANGAVFSVPEELVDATVRLRPSPP